MKILGKSLFEVSFITGCNIIYSAGNSAAYYENPTNNNRALFMNTNKINRLSRTFFCGICNSRDVLYNSFVVNIFRHTAEF